MAFALLLCLGWGVTDALNAIRGARPIVGLIYADDAISWFGRRAGWSLDQEADAQAELTAWLEGTFMPTWRLSRKFMPLIFCAFVC